MKKERKNKHFIKKPVYDGGLKAMRAFISQNKKYPKEALENKVEGTVYIKYSIDHKGKVIDVKVIKSLGHGCDEEAIRVVKLLKFQVPKNRGVRVKFNKNIQIHFRLPKQKTPPQKPKTQSTQYAYSITPTKKKEEKPTKKKDGGGYSIRINY